MNKYKFLPRDFNSLIIHTKVTYHLIDYIVHHIISSQIVLDEKNKKISFSVYDTFLKVIVNNPLDVESIENQLVHLLFYILLDLIEHE
jgi:hypothetical protein